MPSIEKHIERSISSNAEQIHRTLDMPPGYVQRVGKPFDWKLHGIWRRITHQPKNAMRIGYALGGFNGMCDAFKHINDDYAQGLITVIRRKRKRKKLSPTIKKMDTMLKSYLYRKK